jgi:hypothetical protein
MLVFPAVGATWSLNKFLGAVDVWLHLYVNDVQPDGNSTLATFVEASWNTYAPLEVKTWTPAIWINNQAAAQADPALWTLTSNIFAVQVYGYFATDSLTGPLLWAEYDPNGPVTLQFAGDKVQVNPSLTWTTNPNPTP